MAAYGALISVMNIIDQLQTHPSPPISINQKKVESLIQSLTSLQHFLESYSPHGGCTEHEDYWESRIAEAAYDAEDVIESYIVDQIRARSEIDVQHKSSPEFYQGLEKVIENMNLIKIEIDEKMVVQDQLHIMKSVPPPAAVGSSRSTSTDKNVTMIGFDDVMLEMLDKITGGGLTRQIIPIVGMGGIGKTTLARNIYVSPLVTESFDVCAWSTISQGYNAREILKQVLDQVHKGKGGDLSVDELGDHLYKYLFGRKYFIVMDDMWNMEAWDRVKRFFPDNRNKSRIVVTTRQSNLASHLNSSSCLVLNFLDEDASWNLFSKTVFGEEACPLELEDVGKKIVKGCKGLPLSVAVIGGLLVKSERTIESWGLFENNLSSIVNLEDNENCLQILYTSYNNLPVHLKPCFLYLGKYDEDEVIRISQVILCFVAEGFIKPINGKSFEEVAEKYVEELVDRNLLIVEKRKHCGKLKSLKMHDLMRDVCLREARKLKFLHVPQQKSIPDGMLPYRRTLRVSWRRECDQYAPLVRSYFGIATRMVSENFRLLRVSMFNVEHGTGHLKNHLNQINLRLLSLNVDVHMLECLPSSFSFAWNVQTLILNTTILEAYDLDLWKMPQLRHVRIINYGKKDGAFHVPDPLSDEEDMVMENLQSLGRVFNLKFCAGVLKRIPNIKTLKLCYKRIEGKEDEDDDYQLHKIGCLLKLESLGLRSSREYSHCMREVSFPDSLKKLTLQFTFFDWNDTMNKIGSLPLLQVLKLKNTSFIGSEWKTLEDQFLNLKFLLIHDCDLECWITDNTHFPRLEHLHLSWIESLRKIPSCIGDIPTLKSIKMLRCSDSVEKSALKIKKKQQELGNECIQIVTATQYCSIHF